MGKYKVSNGLKKSYVAKVGKSGYEGVKELGELNQISVDITENSTSYYAGNRKVIVDKSLSKIEGSLEIPSLTKELEILLFGRSESENGEVIKGAWDQAPYFALQFEQTSKDDETGEEVTDYITLYRVQFQQTGITGKSKEDNPSFAGITLKFEALTLEDGTYMSIVSSDDIEITEDFKTNWGKTVTTPKKKSI